MSEDKKYTYADLENDLKKLTPEQKQRQVVGWREEEGFTISALHNDPQPHYKCEENLLLPAKDYIALSHEEQEDYELARPNGVTVLIEDF